MNEGRNTGKKKRHANEIMKGGRTGRRGKQQPTKLKRHEKDNWNLVVVGQSDFIIVFSFSCP